MAAAAPAAPVPIDPRQQWIDFNLDLWRPNRNPAKTEPGQPSVRKGALTAWNRLSAAARNIVGTELGSRIHQLANGAMAPLPYTAGTHPTANAVVNYFNTLNNGLGAERHLLTAMNNLRDVLPDGAAKTRILNYRDQVQINVNLREQTLGPTQPIMRRFSRLQASIGGLAPAGPGGASPTYTQVNAYLLENLGLLRARVRHREVFGTDLNVTITALAGAADILGLRRRIYFRHLRTQNDSIVALESAITAEVEQWNNFGIDLERTHRTIGHEPNMDNLVPFIKHLDALKALEEATTESDDFRHARQSAQAVSARSEVGELYRWVDALARLHTTWLATTTAEVSRLQQAFHASKWWDREGLTDAEEELLDGVIEKAMLDRESLQADLSDSWIGPFFLGAGGHGRASMWIKQDSTGHIVDRVVVKDAPNQNPNHLEVTGVWQPPEGWPMEAAAMYKLVDLPGSNSIVSIRNWRSKLPWDEGGRLNYRIYMEFCSGGDMYGLWANCYPRAGNDHMPEPFIWAVLDSLITAGQLMEGGHLRKEARPLWDQIIHGDMKEDNVFLGENTTGTFRGYPLQAKLGDFGIATIFPARGISPPDNWVAFSGGGYRAPELAKIWPIGNAGATMPDSKANVWGVGMILRRLLQWHAMHGVWRNINQGQPWQPPDFNPGEHLRYSQSLRDLITNCLRPNPQHRPSFTMLRQEVLNQNQHSTNDDLRGLRDAPPDDERFERLGPPGHVDRYALGLAVRDLEYHGIPQRVPSPPAEDSPSVDPIGGTQGALVTGAEHTDNAEHAFKFSVMDRKRTFETMQAG